MTMEAATSRIVRASLVGAAMLILGLVGCVRTDRAAAEMKITQFETEVSTTQAGGHPDIHYVEDWTNRKQTFDPCNCEDPRILDTHFPTGFIGDPQAVPVCPLAEFALHQCSPDSQVGVLSINTGELTRRAIYNIHPHEGEPGLLGFTIPLFEVPTFTVLHGRTGSDYGLDATTVPLFHPVVFNTLDIHIWGVPADPSHDANRFPPEVTQANEQICKPYPEGCLAPVSANVPPAPYLQNPTTCGEPLTAHFDVQFYEGVVAHTEYPWGTTTGCDQLRFDPSLTALPTTTSADSPSGLDIDLKVPQPQSPTAPSPSEIRAVKMVLPRGFSLLSSAANGKVGCEDADLNFESEEEAHCPEFSKIGSSKIDSSALPGPIDGSVYLGQPRPGDVYRVFVTGNGFATHVKLKGSAYLDPITGQVTTEFVNLPQSPIQGVELHLFGSERGIFGTPVKCGSYSVEAEFTPWDAVLPNQTSANSFEIDSGPGGTPCPGATRPLSPSFRAGAADNTAGAFSPFAVQLLRNDGEQNLTTLKLTQPTGWLASLKGVTYCSDATLARLVQNAYSAATEAASPVCPASSLVGTAVAGAGAGSRPIYERGSVFLAGPYKGAPLSIETVVPARSGPYDFGNIAVRAAVEVDPVTAQVTAIADPIPQLIEGVPLRTRSLEIHLDRPGFALNPTNCEPSTESATVGGDEGATASVSSRFQVANCGNLEYEPGLKIRLSGGVKHLGHPGIHATVTAKAGEANTRRVVVTLPKGFLLDNEHFSNVCTRAQFAARSCPANSQIGTASLTTPLLDGPLAGPVYLRSSSHGLPDVAVALEGQVSIEVSARVDNTHERFRTTFTNIPDAPVASFSLNLYGASKGLLVNEENLCDQPRKALVQMTGQNGAVVTTKPALQIPCGGTGRSKKHQRSHGGRKG